MNNTEELLNTIDKAFTGLMSKVEAVEKTAYNKVLESIAGLEYKNGRLLPNAKNMRVMAEMKGGLTSVLRSPQYVEAVTKFGKQYDVVAKVQNNYFEAIVKDFKPSGAVEITKKMSINTMVDNLVGGGVNQEVTQKAANILLQNIQGGSTVMKLTEDLRNFMLTTPEGLGSLNRYASQIANDSINQYAAAYNEQITEDLGFEWFQYVGSLRDTSRDFCVALVSQRYIHKSEFAKAAKGILRNKTVSTAGMYKTTDANTLTVLRGGYTCKHQFRGVATGTVPQSVRDAVTGAKAEEPTSGFVEAKTIEDAEIFAKNNLIDKKRLEYIEKENKSIDIWLEKNPGGIAKRPVSVSYKGLNIDVANAINKKIYQELNFTKAPLLQRIEARRVNKSSWSARMSTSGDLEINTGKFKNLTDFFELNEIEKLRDQLPKLKQMQSIGKIPAQYNHILKRAEEIIKFDSITASKNPIDIITHELGHHTFNNVHNIAKIKNLDFEKIQQLVGDGIKDSIKNDLYKYKLTYYAFEDFMAVSHEVFAEAYTLYRNKEFSRLSPNFLELFKTIL